jgi:hypothetical protein
MKNLMIVCAPFGRDVASRYGSDLSAGSVMSARLSSVKHIKPGLGHVLLGGIFWALIAAIIAGASTIATVNLLRLL